jgi:hypothetical protein
LLDELSYSQRLSGLSRKAEGIISVIAKTILWPQQNGIPFGQQTVIFAYIIKLIFGLIMEYAYYSIILKSPDVDDYEIKA